MTSMSTDEAARSFAAVVERAAGGKERVVLTRDGLELAAVVPIDDVRLLQDLEDRLDVAEAMTALAGADEHDTIPFERIEPAPAVG